MASRVNRPFMKRLLLSLGAAVFAVGCATTPPPGVGHRPPAPPPPQVVLVHGFLENGSTFKWLKQRLEQHGAVCLVPKLRPNDGRGGLEGLAVRLQHDIDSAFGPHQPISIVAFSMGGLVSRYYLQNLGGAARCRQLITISTPHHGTDSAWYYPTQGAAQMRPGSRFLADLEQSQSKLGKMPVVSYRTPMDMVIIPPESSVWQRAENVQYPVLLHSMMLTSEVVLTDLERRLFE